jgi:hypothetical protein
MHFLIQQTGHTQIPTCFDTEVPPSGSYYSKGAKTNLLIYILLIGTDAANDSCIVTHHKSSLQLILCILTILCTCTIKRFNYGHKNEQNWYGQVSLHIFVVITPWRWHLGAETCSSLCVCVCVCVCVCHTSCIARRICWTIYWLQEHAPYE